MPRKLYKYRAFNVLTLRALTEAEVFYAEPTSFNDPMDCDPTIEVDVDWSTLEKLHYRMLRQRLEKDPAIAEMNRIRYYSSEFGSFRKDKEAQDYLIWANAAGVKDELQEEFGSCGVLSLSATWASALMWSHYANEHRGVCIEYDTSEQEHPRLKPVSYRAPRSIKTSDLVAWKMKDDVAARDRVLGTYFYAKSGEWRYEKEWRDLRDQSGREELPFRITAIHFGLRCDAAVITSVVKLLAHKSDIKLYDIRPKGDTFKLRRSLIDRHEIEALGVRDPSFITDRDFEWPEIEDGISDESGVGAGDGQSVAADDSGDPIIVG